MREKTYSEFVKLPLLCSSNYLVKEIERKRTVLTSIETERK